jgi:hypothetical protein
MRLDTNHRGSKDRHPLEGTSASALRIRYVRTYKNETPSPLTRPASLEMLKHRDNAQNPNLLVTWRASSKRGHTEVGAEYCINRSALFRNPDRPTPWQRYQYLQRNCPPAAIRKSQPYLWRMQKFQEFQCKFIVVVDGQLTQKRVRDDQFRQLFSYGVPWPPSRAFR